MLERKTWGSRVCVTEQLVMEMCMMEPPLREDVWEGAGCERVLCKGAAGKGGERGNRGVEEPCM